MSNGWLAWTVTLLLVVGVALLFQILFLLSLRNTLRRVSNDNRAMSADYVWFILIPFFGWIWFIYVVAKVRDSLRAEYRSRGWLAEGDFGYSMGLAAAVLGIVTMIWAWVPWDLILAEFVLVAGQVICWIVYWVKIARMKERLGPSSPSLFAGPVAPGEGPGTDKETRCCANCGTAVMRDDRFCWFCGSPLS